MSEQLTIKELQALYNELLPMFQSVVVVSNSEVAGSVKDVFAEIAANKELDTAIQKRNKQDEEDKKKIRGAFNW